MKRLKLRIDKEALLMEVAKTTAYEGAKTVADGIDYDRLLTTDEDREMLERYWVEACGKATERMKRLVEVAKVLETGYEAILRMSDDYDDGLTASIEAGLQSYAVAQIVSKWLRLCKHLDEAERYGTDALKALDEVMQKLWHRKRPKAPRRCHHLFPERAETEWEADWREPLASIGCGQKKTDTNDGTEANANAEEDIRTLEEEAYALGEVRGEMGQII